MIRQVPPKTLVRCHVSRSDGIMLRHRTSNKTAQILLDSGVALVAREEISVKRDQSEKLSFMPLRLLMPYGVWTRADGALVYFSRDYCPIWVKNPNSVVESIFPETWIEFTKQEYFWRSGEAPWEKKITLEKCRSLLAALGVSGRRPELTKILDLLIRTNEQNISISREVDKLRHRKETPSSHIH